MKYKIMYRCSMCDDLFQKGLITVNQKIQNHNYAKAALFFNDKMKNYKKLHPAHLCYHTDTVVLKCGIGEFAGLQLDEES